MVKMKWTVFTVVSVILSVACVASAANTERIDNLLASAEKNNQALGTLESGVIDNFLAEVFDELLAAEGQAEMVTARLQITFRKGTEKTGHYSSSFVLAVRRQLKDIFGQLDSWDDKVRLQQVTRNLIILVAEMESLVLVDFGIDNLGDNDVIIRYWAVKAISQPAIAAQLNSEMTADADVADKIVTALDKVVETETYGEILDLIVRFAASLDTIRARELLLKFADMRIAAYEDWSVSDEHIDAVLLNGIGAVAAKNSVTRKEAGQKFAQLYSYVIQRFILGADVLSEDSLAAMASVIVDVEAGAVSKILGRTQRAIRTAVEKKTYPALQREHDDLFGLPGIAGKLPVKLSFDYGKGPNGTLTTPKKLTPPAKPKEADTNAE